MNKKKIIAFSVAVGVILTLILGFVIGKGTINPGKRTFQELNIFIEERDIRVGIVFNISIENIPDDCNAIWDMGDGNISFGQSIEHSYYESGIFQINVEAKWKDHIGNKTIEISVKNADLIREQSYPGHYDIRLRSQSGRGIFVPIESGITIPSIEIFINISLASGDIGARVTVSKDGELHILFTETQYVFREELRFHYSLNQNDYTYFDPLTICLLIHGSRKGELMSFQSESRFIIKNGMQYNNKHRNGCHQ